MSYWTKTKDYNMAEPVSVATTAVIGLKYLFLLIIPFVEPQLAGILGAWCYVMVRHELNMESFSISCVIKITFFGWMGAWATVNLLADVESINHAWTQIISASMGFMMYDILMSIGANTTSVIGFFANIIKDVITKRIDKWNS